MALAAPSRQTWLKPLARVRLPSRSESLGSEPATLHGLRVELRRDHPLRADAGAPAHSYASTCRRGGKLDRCGRPHLAGSRRPDAVDDVGWGVDGRRLACDRRRFSVEAPTFPCDRSRTTLAHGCGPGASCQCRLREPAFSGTNDMIGGRKVSEPSRLARLREILRASLCRRTPPGIALP